MGSTPSFTTPIDARSAPEHIPEGAAPSFAARVDARNGIANIQLSGELDFAAVPMVEAHLGILEDGRVSVIMVDLRDLTFMDCAGLQVLMAARHRAKANQHRLLVVGASKPARRLFELTRTTFMLDEDDVLDALDRFTGGGRGDGYDKSSDVAADA